MKTHANNKVVNLTTPQNEQERINTTKKVTILENGIKLLDEDEIQAVPRTSRRLSTSTENMCRLKNMSTMNETVDTLHLNAEVR